MKCHLDPCKCPNCGRWIDTWAEHKIDEDWSEGIPLREDNYYVSCNHCGEEFAVDIFDVVLHKKGNIEVTQLVSHGRTGCLEGDR